MIDVASTGERTGAVTATAPSHAIPTTQPIELDETTPKKENIIFTQQRPIVMKTL
jgi:hypothetical protein